VAVDELLLRCSTTSGIVEKRVQRDSVDVSVSAAVVAASFSSHDAVVFISAVRYGFDGGAVRFVSLDRLRAPLPLQQLPLLAAKRHLEADQALYAECTLAWRAMTESFVIDPTRKKVIGNRLQSLPAELGLMTNLRTLAVRSRSRSTWTSISRDLTAGLQISSNQLTCLPAWLGQLTQLQHLYVRVVFMV
jgi:hypothetical protein